MNISRIFILRPIATSLLMAALLLSGLLAYRYLPIAALPQIDYPTMQVQTFYPGASPDVMAAVVTAPLERQFGTMSGLVQMSSQSSAGASVITLQFDLSVPLDVAEQEVQAAINAADSLLRLETCVLFAGFDLPVNAIRNQIVAALNYIIHTGRLEDGSRKVLGISRVLPLDHGEYRLESEWEWIQTGVDASGKFTGEFRKVKQ